MDTVVPEFWVPCDRGVLRGGGGGGRRLVYVICLPPPCSLPGAGPRLSFSVSGRSPAGRERWLEDIHYNDNNSHATYHLLFAVAK